MSTQKSTQNVEYFFEYFFENFFEDFFETFTMIKPTSGALVNGTGRSCRASGTTSSASRSRLEACARDESSV